MHSVTLGTQAVIQHSSSRWQQCARLFHRQAPIIIKGLSKFEPHRENYCGPRLTDCKPMHMRDSHLEAIAVKVPQVTLAFWIVKILATTLGETAGDAVTMSWLGETSICRLAAFVSALVPSRSSFLFKRAAHSRQFRQFSRVARPL